MKQLQQGDVNIEKMDNIFFDSIKEKSIVNRELRGFVIAHGESGHFHVIEQKKDVELFEYYDDYLEEKCLLLRLLKDGIKLKHEEHKEITLDKGDYRINRVYEYDPFERLEKKVQD